MFLFLLVSLLTVSMVNGNYTNTTSTSLGLNVLSFQRQNRGIRVSDGIGCNSLTTCSTAGPNNKGFLTITYFNEKNCTGHVVEIYATTLGLCSPTVDGRGMVHSTSTIHLYQETYPTSTCIGQPMEERVPMSSTECVELTNQKFGSYSMKLLPEETLSHHGVILAGASSTACICSPTAAPVGPTYAPTIEPTQSPKPSFFPSYVPTVIPTAPTYEPTQEPTPKAGSPSYVPTPLPTWEPTCTDINQCGYDCDYTRHYYNWGCIYLYNSLGCLCTGCSLCAETTYRPSGVPTVVPSRPTPVPTSRPTPVPTLSPTRTTCVDQDWCDCDTRVRNGWTCATMYKNYGCLCTGCSLCPAYTYNPTYTPTYEPSKLTMAPTFSPSSEPFAVTAYPTKTSNPSFNPTTSIPTLVPTYEPTFEPKPTPIPTIAPTACICNSPAPTYKPTQEAINFGGGKAVISATQTVTSLTSAVASTTAFQLEFTTDVAYYANVPTASVTWISATPISGSRTLLLPGMNILYSVINVSPDVGTKLQNSGSSLTDAIIVKYPGLTVADATVVLQPFQSTSTPSLAATLVPTSIRKSGGSVDMPKYRYDLMILSTMIVSGVSFMLFDA